MDEVEELHQQHRLRLETRLVVIVRYNEEHILQDSNKEALEEGVGSVGVRLFSNVGNQLQAHVKTSSFNISVVMLECPRARIDDKLELVVVKFK